MVEEKFAEEFHHKHEVPREIENVDERKMAQKMIKAVDKIVAKEEFRDKIKMLFI